MATQKTKIVQCLVFGALVAPLLFHKLWDIDIWWHLELGRSFLTSGFQIPWHEMYFTPVQTPVLDLRFTFLGDTIFYMVHQVGGDLGLQVFGVFLVLLGTWFVWKITGSQSNYTVAIILILMLIASSQLQMVRNAMYSFAMLPAFLWATKKWEGKRILLMIPFLAFWSTLHGSYLLGLGLMGLHVYGVFLRSFVDNEPYQNLKFPIIAFALGLVACAIGNPFTIEFLNTMVFEKWVFILGILFLGAIYIVVANKKWPILRQRKPLLFFHILAMVALVGLAYSKTDQMDIATIDLRQPSQVIHTDQGPWERLKFALNHTLWQPEGYLQSTDFSSPLDHLERGTILLTYLLAVLALVGFQKKRATMEEFLTFSFFVLLGLGYLRMTSYLAIYSTICVLRRLDFQQAWLNHKSIAGACILLLVTPHLPGHILSRRTLGLGKPANMETRLVREWAVRDEPLFCTVRNGGYLNYRWADKPIFVDGFFAPHLGETFEIYQSILEGESTNTLVDEFNVKHALISQSDLIWISQFGSSQDWYPTQMDQGYILFQYVPAGNQAPDFQLEKPQEMNSTFANRLWEIPNMFLLKGQISKAQGFLEMNQSELSEAKAFADPKTINQIEQNLNLIKEFYEGDAPKAKALFEYQKAKGRPDYAAMLKWGTELLGTSKREETLRLELAAAAAQQNQIQEAFNFLSGMRQPLGDPTTIESAWFGLCEEARSRKEFALAFQANLKAHKMAGDDSSRPIKFGLDLYRQSRESQSIQEGLTLLQAMRNAFPAHPAILYNLAFHASEYPELGFSLDQALAFALRAVEENEMQGGANQAVFLDNVAEIYYKMGQLEMAQDYEQQSYKAMPEAQKSQFRSRF